MMIEARIEFDTHAMTTKLRAGGLDEAAASAITYAVRDIAMSNVATRQDVKDVAHTMTVRFGAMLAAAVAALGAIIAAFH